MLGLMLTMLAKGATDLHGPQPQVGAHFMTNKPIYQDTLLPMISTHLGPIT